MTVGSKVKQTLATLNGIESTLRVYSSNEINENFKIVLKDALQTTGEVIKDIEDRAKFIELQEPQYKGN
jgi:predicted DNA-binding protein YlxM (UPF0122 family)